jgi:hypothetical protein
MHFEARISVHIGVHTVPGVSCSAHASYTVQFSLSSVSSVQFNLTPTFPRQRLDRYKRLVLHHFGNLQIVAYNSSRKYLFTFGTAVPFETVETVWQG